MGERRSLPRAQNVKGKLRDVKRPACLQRQTGACRRCGPAACQPCRGREEPVGAQDLSATDRRTPTDQLRTRRRARSVPESSGESDRLPTPALSPTNGAINSDSPDQCPASEAINPNRQTGSQRKERSTPTVRRVSSGRRAYHSNRRTGPRTESYVKSVVSIRAACEGPTSTPLQQHSLVGDQGRANHPPVMPVRQGSRTQVSMVGNLGQKPNSEAIIAASGAAKEGLQDPPPANCRQIVH